MSITDQRPDPNTVSHEAVAAIAQRRVGDLTQDVILRDAKIQEQQKYIAALEAENASLQQQISDSNPPAAFAPTRPGADTTAGAPPESWTPNERVDQAVM